MKNYVKIGFALGFGMWWGKDIALRLDRCAIKILDELGRRGFKYIDDRECIKDPDLELLRPLIRTVYKLYGCTPKSECKNEHKMGFHL